MLTAIVFCDVDYNIDNQQLTIEIMWLRAKLNVSFIVKNNLNVLHDDVVEQLNICIFKII